MAANPFAKFEKPGKAVAPKGKVPALKAGKAAGKGNPFAKAPAFAKGGPVKRGC